MDNQKIPTDMLTALLVALIGLIPLAFELADGESSNIAGFIILTSIFVFIAFYFVYTFVWVKVKKYINQISDNSKRIEEIGKTLDYKEQFHQFDKRVSALEMHMKKRGQIDPRTVIFIILLILLFLYLRNRGIL
ncbi:hypothetical protein HYU14_03490 [Candidatus Woesearchaeota archaeon]|nr:hypothetical protein [Candidatus Woesearchaeota archaeon]